MEKILFFKKGSMTTFWSKEDEKALAEAFNYRFSKYLKEELFFIESALCQENLQVRVTLKSKENDKSYPVEAVSLLGDDPKKNLTKTSKYTMELVGDYFEEYFSSKREIFLPLDWSSHDYKGVTILLRGFLRDLKLENLADKFFEEHGHGEYEISTITDEGQE
jgi:hypothetical protein